MENKSNNRTSYEKEILNGDKINKKFKINELELLQLKLDAQDFFKVDEQ